MGTYIDVRSPFIAPGQPAITQFSDTLLRAGFTLGTPWIIGYSDPTQVGWFQATGGIFTNGGTGLNLKNPTGGGSAANIPIIPAVSSRWGGVTQFAEAAVISVTNSGASGPAVSMCGNSSEGTANGYFLRPNFLNNVDLFVANVGQRTIQLTVTTWAANDVLRLGIIFGSSSNSLIVTKNGTTITTLTDNNALRPISTNLGFPGMFFAGASAAAASQFKNFRCGIGLG